MSVSVENLTKIYGTQKAVNNIKFKVETGQIAGFLGPNGAGKSTTMKIITGCISADEGTVLINGIPADAQNEDLKRIIGYLPENNPLYPDMYVREYLEYTAGLYMKNTFIKKAVDYAVDAVGLGNEQYKKTAGLSKGYKQRTGLAAALIHNPQVLILDEPTTGLDPNQIIEIRNLIKELGKEKTVILSTHIMQEAEAICSRAIIINKGEIAADDTIENLKKEQNANTVEVEFNKEFTTQEIKNYIGTIKSINATNGKYLISTEPDIDIRKDLFDFAVKQNAAIIEIQKKENSLESIFGKITKN